MFGGALLLGIARRSTVLSGVEGRESQAMRGSTLKNEWGPKVHACQKEG